VRSIDEAPLLVFTGADADRARVEALSSAGAEVISFAGDRERRLADALAELGRRGIGSLLVEGGAELAGSLLAAGEVDQLRVFIAPVVLGAGRPLAAGSGFERVADAARPIGVEWERVGEDMLASARLREW
jgi:diaminohydroxyphosphoribosylaminopyrimidine deaminase/5-amino-6-(5-phosphoribosylamino)uracil reductase